MAEPPEGDLAAAIRDRTAANIAARLDAYLPGESFLLRPGEPALAMERTIRGRLDRYQQRTEDYPLEIRWAVTGPGLPVWEGSVPAEDPGALCEAVSVVANTVVRRAQNTPGVTAAQVAVKERSCPQLRGEDR